MNVFDFTARDLSGARGRLRNGAGRCCCIVNVASECGFTPQYAGLEKLYRRHKDRGFAVLGFPCDQFGHQEPGDEAAIAAFCSDNYDVTFPMFAKIEVNGPGAHPLYRHLKSARRGIARNSGDEVELHQVPGRSATARCCSALPRRRRRGRLRGPSFPFSRGSHPKP